MLRFAILKTVGDKESSVVLEYSAEQILSRLQARLRENLIKTETIIKLKHPKDEIEKAFTDAFNGLVAEFKEKTVTLK